MKWKLTLVAILCIFSSLSAQDTLNEPAPGKISARIFTHFNYSLDGLSSTAFEVRRAYFGYKRELDDHFSAEVKLDIGSIDDQSEFSLIRRYTYFKNAYLSYQTGNLKTWFGLFDMLQFKIQEKFWGYRYIYKSFMDEYRFGSSADLGAGIEYSPGKLLTADLIFSNGEGYKDLQFDKIYRLGTGITLTPVEGLILRGYFTIHTYEVRQMILSGFAGYRMKKLRLGAEYNQLFNYKFLEGYNQFGFSVYSTYTFSEKWEIFARYDQIYSNILPEEEIPWNLAGDGSAIIAGVQFTPAPFVHLALDYQDWVEYARNGSAEPYLYLNIEIVF